MEGRSHSSPRKRRGEGAVAAAAAAAADPPWEVSAAQTGPSPGNAFHDVDSMELKKLRGKGSGDLEQGS